MARLMHHEIEEGNTCDTQAGRMFKEVLQKIRQFLISVWHSIRKEAPIVMILVGNPSMRQTPVPNVSFDVYTRTGSMWYRRRQRFDNSIAPRLLPFKREVRGFPLLLQEDTVKIRVWVGTSRIAGKGLFAAQDIEKGTRIIQYIGARISKEESLRRLAEGNAYLFEFNARDDIDGKTLKNTARYINHSCDPNCEVHITKSTIWIVAKRDIQDGEELSYNYGYTAKHYRCWCRAKNCCGYILGEEYWHS